MVLILLGAFLYYAKLNGFELASQINIIVLSTTKQERLTHSKPFIKSTVTNNFIKKYSKFIRLT